MTPVDNARANINLQSRQSGQQALSSNRSVQNINAFHIRALWKQVENGKSGFSKIVLIAKLLCLVSSTHKNHDCLIIYRIRCE